LNLVADAARVTQEFASFLKRSIDSHPNDCNAIAFYGLLVKTTKSIQGFLSDFMESKNHTQKRLAYLPENLGKRLSIDETALPMENSILHQPAAKGKKGTIVAMIVELKLRLS
jgi:hypothetical protein